MVAHPGATDAFFAVSRGEQRLRPRILFVGGDFERKGGSQLLEAYEALSAPADLLIVSDSEIVLPAGVEQEKGVTPASERLLAAYARSDIFCLPTLADCTPVVLGEAMAAGLPVVTTSVGSNTETVVDGEEGLVVEPGDARALAVALEQLVSDAALRKRMSDAARATAQERLSAAKNAGRLFEFLGGVA
jgi:glycosyltransferase involved in cell wall biosynthesis